MTASVKRLWTTLPKALAATVVMFVVASVVASSYIVSHRYGYPPIRSDGYGYYAYLTSIFIDHGLGFQTAILNMPDGPVMPNYGLSYFPGTGRILDKYTMGLAVLSTPFFLAAHLWAYLSGASMNGVSTPYQVGCLASATFYAAVGLAFAYKLLRVFTSKRVSIITLWCFILGTNLFHYTTYDAAFSHVYSFCLVAIFSYVLLRRPELTTRSSLLAGLVLGLVIMTRVPNAIVVVLYLWQAATALRRGGRAALPGVVRNTLVFGVGTLVTLSPQLAYWYRTTGHLFLNSYGDERFYFANPQFVNFLFSVEKGMFFWSPILLVAVIALVIVGVRARLPEFPRFALAIPIGVVLALHVYLCASWWAWDFGGSYGCRVVVDMLPLYMVPFALLLAQMSKRVAIVAAVPVALMCMANICLMYAYWRAWIPYSHTTLHILKAVPQRLLDAVLR